MVLPNVKQEAFCQNIITSVRTGWAQGECYSRAGFTASGRAADACAARMLTRDNIRARIAELQAPAIWKSRTTVDSLASQFDAVFDAALAEKQLGAAGNAAGLKAKLLGFMRERIEVGSVGDFPDCTTPADVIAALIDDHGGDARSILALLDNMRAIVQEIVADQARTILPNLASPQPALRGNRRRPDHHRA